MAKKSVSNETVSLETGQFKRGKALVVPTLSVKQMKTGDSLFVEFTEEPVTKKQLNKKGEPLIDMETGAELTITSAQVIDLTTGALGELVLGFIICKALAPRGALVGKRFEFIKGEKSGRTNLWSVYDLEVE
jgi:hypothetical protein